MAPRANRASYGAEHNSIRKYSDSLFTSYGAFCRNVDFDKMTFQLSVEIVSINSRKKVTELQEDVEYQVDFVCGCHEMAILVSLSPDFPLEKPILKIKPQIIHPWVNKQSEVTDAPGLLNFTVHSDLGRIVQAIIRDLERKPPPLASDGQCITVNTTPLVNGTISPTCGLPMFDTCNSVYPSDSGSNTHHQLRTQSATFPELSNLTIEELQQLNKSDDRLSTFVDDCTVTKRMNKAIDDLMLKNEELAELNLSKQPLLEQLRHQVIEKQLQVQSCKKSYDLASEKYKTLSDKYSPQNIKESLRSASLLCDEESEKIAERFLNKETNVDTFLEKYIDRRMLSHTRKTKEEKLSYQLKELHRAGY